MNIESLDGFATAIGAVAAYARLGYDVAGGDRDNTRFVMDNERTNSRVVIVEHMVGDVEVGSVNPSEPVRVDYWL